MFDFGFSEMLLTAVIALLVLGPKRLPRAAQTLGLWVRRARASWFSLRAELERELADEDMKSSLREARDEVRKLKRELEAPLIPMPASESSRLALQDVEGAHNVDDAGQNGGAAEPPSKDANR